MTVETENRPVHLGKAARAHIPLIVITTVLGLALGFLASTQLSSSATATTTILLNPLDGNPFYPSTRGEQLVNLGTEAEALRSDAVANMVKSATGSDLDAADLLAGVSVSNPPNTQILEVTFTSDSVDEAEKYSQAFADSYLAYRKQQADKVIDGQVQQLDAQIAEAQQQLTAIAAQAAGLPNSSPQAEVLRRQAQTASDQISSLGATRADLLALPRDPGQVVTPASGTEPGSSKLGLIVILAGGLVGAGAGLAFAAARSVSDRRIHTVEDLDALDVPVLGAFGIGAEAPKPGDAARTAAADDQIRRIRAALLARGHVQPWVLLVTGASPREHAPLVVPELAGAFARSGLETIVLHANLRSPDPSPLVPTDSPVGLCQLLTGRTTASESLKSVGPMLWAVPVGDTSDEVTDLFVGEPMQRLVRELKSRCDVLIVSADPIDDGATQSLTRAVDAVLLEVDQHISTTSEVREAMRTLRMLAVPVDGAVLVGPAAEQWARDFVPHLTMPQRELVAGPAQLPPGALAVPPAPTTDGGDTAAPPPVPERPGWQPHPDGPPPTAGTNGTDLAKPRIRPAERPESKTGGRGASA
jgi:succinoglycan biosynthesis transport protein ExoP